MGKRNYNSLFNQILEKIMEYDGHVYFVTLTMKDDSVLDKYTVGNFIHKMKYRDVCIDGYIWVKELQKRGVVHYHMLILTAEKMRNFYDKVNESWGYGWVFVKGVEKEKVRSTILYIMKYLKKELDNKVENEKMKRKIGRGGVLRFRKETFVSRVVKYSEFEYVGGASSKGVSLKIYRFMDMIMFVACTRYGVSIDVLDSWCVNEIVDKFKYEINSYEIGSLLENSQYWTLTEDEREDILGYHDFNLALDSILV